MIVLALAALLLLAIGVILTILAFFNLVPVAVPIVVAAIGFILAVCFFVYEIKHAVTYEDEGSFTKTEIDKQSPKNKDVD